jgi:hypothetical protein
MLYTEELVEVARTALVDAEAKYGKMRPVSDEALLGWAKLAKPKLDELIAREFEAHATHPDFMMVSDEEQEELHLDMNTQVVSLLVDGLVARVWNIS